jgi:hypothetical protein
MPRKPARMKKVRIDWTAERDATERQRLDWIVLCDMWRPAPSAVHPNPSRERDEVAERSQGEG